MDRSTLESEEGIKEEKIFNSFIMDEVPEQQLPFTLLIFMNHVRIVYQLLFTMLFCRYIRSGLFSIF